MNQPLPAVEAASKSSGRILVVEDDRHIRRIISMGLKLEGFEVITAENGKVALEKLATYGADAITLDLMMPVMDGRTFIQRARNELKTSIPIIVLTSVDRDEATRDLLESGASAILYKPATVIEIIATLQQVCR